MADINTETLCRLVACKLSTISSSCNSEEFLAVIAANSIDPSNRRFSIATPDDLPYLRGNTLPSGTVVFVRSMNIHLISQGEQWWSLDGRLYRDDSLIRTVWSWGQNNRGQLGDNTIVNKSSPVSAIGGITNWCRVSAGNEHVAAIRANGTIWTWGSNGVGELGNNTLVSTSSPVSVVGGFTDWCQVSTSRTSSFAIRTNGTLWSWGWNTQGQLGNGTIIDRSSPVSVVGGFTDWCQVDGGRSHTLGIRSNGTIWSWGYNSYGQLGTGGYTDVSSPVSVVGGFTDWCQVSAGEKHTAAVRTNGTLWTWGYGALGRLGDGTCVTKSSPVSVVGGFTDWCQVSSGYSHTAAVRTNGTLWTWGYGALGRLGDGTCVTKSSPVSVVGGFTDWCQVSAGYTHSAAIRTNGTIWSWGYNGQGQLGDNTGINKTSPVSVVGGVTSWCFVTTANASGSTLAIKVV